MRSVARSALRRGLVWLTRGQLVNLSAAIYEQPTPFPAKGPGRHLKVRPDDTFIVSYPRSGNTWLRFLVANLKYSGRIIDYGNIEDLVPDIYASSELRLRGMPGPRILKSHEAFDPRYRRVIYAVRDPRDVIVSQFTTLRRLRSDIVGNSFEKFVERQLAGEFDAWFGSWSANVNSWIYQDKADLDFLIVRYEDIRKDTPDIAAKIANFLGFNCSLDALHEAVANSSRGRMNELYARSGASLEQTVGMVNAGQLRPNSGSDDPKMTPEIERRIRERYGALMGSLGYT